jgi:two-component system cell cycle sensor histidine kinase PleC
MEVVMLEKLLGVKIPLVVLLISLTAFILIDIFLVKNRRKIVLEQKKLKETLDNHIIEYDNLNTMINCLKDLYNDALEYDKQKTEFFANIIHELKAPLNVILGALKLTEQQLSTFIKTKALEKNLHIIKQNSFRLLRLINNLLDMSRIDSGHQTFNPVNCNVVYLIEEIVRSVLPYAQYKNLSIEFDTDVEEIIAAVDMEKIERIMLNLLSNAIKFNKPGGHIWVHVKKEDEKIFISVKDTGPGISKDKYEEIFERFKQIGSRPASEYEGSGIGLSLVKSYVQLHNGNIRIVSEPDKGSEFIVEIPISISDSEEAVLFPSNERQKKITGVLNIELSDITSL